MHKHDGAAGYIFNNDELLLIHHVKLDLWIPPGGHVEPGEIPHETVIRECGEELDLDVLVLDTKDVPVVDAVKQNCPVPFYVNVHNVGDHNHLGFYYVCIALNPDHIRPDGMEVDNFRWYKKEDLYRPEISDEVKSIANLAFDKYETLKHH